MHMQDEEMLFELVPGEHLYENVDTLKHLMNVSGVLVDVMVRDGKTSLSIRYSKEFTEYLRNRNAGRPRKKDTLNSTCGEVFSLKEAKGAKVAAATFGMPIATFYRRCNDNKGKREEEPFI